MASYIDLAPFPPSFSPNGLIADHFRPFLDFGIFGVSYMDSREMTHVWVSREADIYMGQPGG